MASIVRRLLDRLYPTDLGYTVTITGLDYVGKTTLLYLLCLGEVVQTIPSIGFNVETIKAPTASGRPLTLTAWDIGGGCGGMQYMFGLISMYSANGDALIWVVDSTDHERIGESAEACTTVLTTTLARRGNDAKPEGYPILMLVLSR